MSMLYIAMLNSIPFLRIIFNINFLDVARIRLPSPLRRRLRFRSERVVRSFWADLEHVRAVEIVVVAIAIFCRLKKAGLSVYAWIVSLHASVLH